MRILYAEDELSLSNAVTEILKMEGFDVTPVYDGQQAWQALQQSYYDAVVLDIMMPVMDGIAVLKRMREIGNDTPALMLTAKATLDDRVSGLTDGADDYLGKPFAMKELVARLRTLLRRSGSYRHGVLKYGNTVLDCSSCELKTDAGSLRLSSTEAELLAYFIRHPMTYFTAAQMNELLWNGSQSSEKAELYIYYLKNKLRQIRSEAAVLCRADAYALGEDRS